MIGSLPKLRPLARKRRNLPYSTPRRVRKRLVADAQARESRPSERAFFELATGLPQATVVREPSTFTALVTTGIAQWFRDRWSWMRPRMIPLVVAAVGLGITVEAVNQLSKPPSAEATVRATDYNAYSPARIRVVLHQ